MISIPLIMNKHPVNLKRIKRKLRKRSGNKQRLQKRKIAVNSKERK